MTRLHRLLQKQMEKAIHDFKMIEEGDRILVGVSGGADSLSLIKLLRERQILFGQQFSLLAVHIDLGFQSNDYKRERILRSYFDKLGLKGLIIKTRIGEEALSKDARKNPCFICSMYRRRKIYQAAHEHGCNKIAYAHHKDDVIETLLINIIYGRKIEAMNPVQEVFKGKMHIIRPFIYIEEALLKKFVVEAEITTLNKICPVDGKSRRQKIKDIIGALQESEKYANIKENIFKSLRHVSINPESFIPV